MVRACGALNGEVAAGMAAWLRTLEAEGAEARPGRWRYNRHMQRPWGVGSSGFALMILWSTGAIERLDPPLRQAIVEEIRSWQDERTGLFVDPLIKPEHRVLDAHSWEHIHLHNTGVCAEALGCLGERPRFALPQRAFVDLTPATAREQTLAFDWSDPWIYGEQWARSMEAYRRRNRLPKASPGRGEVVELDEVQREAFEALESEILIAETGLPDRRSNVAAQGAVAGLFKVMFAYGVVGRPVPYAGARDRRRAVAADGGGRLRLGQSVHPLGRGVGAEEPRPAVGRGVPLRRHPLGGATAGGVLGRAPPQARRAFSFYREHCWWVNNPPEPPTGPGLPGSAVRRNCSERGSLRHEPKRRENGAGGI